MTVRRGHSQNRGGLSYGGRALALALVALFLQGQLASLLHAVTVRHVVCLEHGELMDVPVASAPAQASPAGRAARIDDGVPAETASGHHHCEYVSATRPRAMTPVAPAIAQAAPPLQLEPAQLPRRQSPPPIQPVLLMAPKTSPPAAA